MAKTKPQTRTQRRAKTIDEFPTIDEIIEKDTFDKEQTSIPVDKIIKLIPIIIIIILLFITGSANSKYNKMKTEVNGYKTKIVSLTDKKKEYEELIESYKKASIEANKTITEQTEKISDLEDSNNKYKNQVKNLNSKVSTLTKNNKTLTSEVKNLKDTNGSLKDQITILKKQKEYANLQIIELTNKTEKDEITITKLNNLIAGRDNTITTLTNKINTANNNIVTLTTTNTELTAKLTNLEEKLTSLNTYKIVNSEMDLIEAVKTGGNILLNTNIMMTSDLEIDDKYISIDLRGYNLVSTAINLKDTSLEIKDSSLTQTGKVNLIGDNDDLVRGIKVNENSTLKITNGIFEGKNLIQIKDNGNVFISGGKFENKQEEAINATENAKLEIIGGTFKE